MLQIGNLAEAETAFSRGLDLGSSDRQAVQALRVLAHMKQGCGEHSEAVKVLTRALDVGVRDQMVQCHFLRGGLVVCTLCLACTRMHTYNRLQEPAAACLERGRHEQIQECNLCVHLHLDGDCHLAITCMRMNQLLKPLFELAHSCEGSVLPS